MYLERRRRGRRATVIVAALASVAALAGGLVGTGVGGDLLGRIRGEPGQPDLTQPNLPAPRAAAPALRALDPATADPQAPAPTQAGLARALGPLLTARALGGGTTAAVVDPGTGEVLYGRGETTAATPASTAKLITGVAVLAAAGPDARLTTKVVAGAAAAQIVLVGGGDPTLTARPAPKPPARGGAGGAVGYPEPARLPDLAAATAQALKQAGTTSVRLQYDDFRFSGPTASPTWEPTYVSGGVVAPVGALMIDEARLRPKTEHAIDPRSKNPARAAAQAFARLLEVNGLQVTGTPTRAKAPADARQLAAVSSPPLSALVEEALTSSDNDLAEALGRQVAVAKGAPASFAGMPGAVRQVLQELQVDVTGMNLVDGSGLSRQNRVPAKTLGQVLAAAASPRHPELRAVLSGLPVAGFTGTLDDRFAAGSAAAAAGVVRAKTGTLSGVSALAGVTRDADGRLLAFAFMANRVPAGADPARAALDRLAAAVAACGC